MTNQGLGKARKRTRAKVTRRARRALAALLMAAPAVFAAGGARHVVVIGVDGMGARWVAEAVSAGKLPHMRGLMAEGSSALHARAVIPTVSSPNWASMIMGAGPSQHGITSNEWELGKAEIKPTCPDRDGRFPTMFGLLRAARPGATQAVFHDWKGFARLVEPAAPSKVVGLAKPAELTAQAIAYWKESRPALLLLHLDLVDHAGHDHEWGSPQYMAALDEADRLIGEVVAAVKAAGAWKDTVLIVSADHGGSGKKHGGMTMGEIEIPWIAAGRGVARGRRLASPVDTFDTAATVVWLFGLKPPACWIGKPVREAFQ